MIRTTIYTPSLRHKLAAALHTLTTMPAMLATLALPLALSTSCTSEELVTPATPTQGQQVTITATLGTNSSNSKPGTRIGYEPDEAINGLKATWTEGDALNILPIYNFGDEGTAQTFTLDATSAGNTKGTFTGTAPEAGDYYRIYYPATIKSLSDFYAFSYTGQVQTGNNNLTHLAKYNSAKIEENNYMTIDFSNPLKSSCMKFALTLPAELTKPTMITLATEDGSVCFRPTNAPGNQVSSLSMELKDITLTDGDNNLIAYMMMYAGGITLPDNIRVTVTGADNKKYYQTIAVGSEHLLKGGMMHSITLKSATNWKELSTTSTTYTDATVASTTLYTENGTATDAGTATNPYLISSAEDLKLVQDATNDVITNSPYYQKCYKLTTDINIALTDNKSWTPIGNNGDRFTGTFDGNGHSITGVYINSDKAHIGFFGYLEDGTVKNLNVEGNITSTCFSGYVGGIAGQIVEWIAESNIIGCSYSGSVTGNEAGVTIGGICGHISGYVIGCYNTSTVTSTDATYCGGIVGNTSNGNDGIIGCYNTGAVTGTDGTKVGGIIAENKGKVMGCYNTGSVTGINNASCGGIIGYNSNDNITGCLWVKSSDAGTATAGIGEETSAGTISPFDNLATLNSADNIATLNSAIDVWNSHADGGNNTPTSPQYCHFKFKAGADAATTPPTLTDGEGTY